MIAQITKKLAVQYSVGSENEKIGHAPPGVHF